MKTAKQRYEDWVTNKDFDEQTRSELLSIKDNLEEIEDRFYQDLQFGTAGLRGVLGAGSNRMNSYTIARAAAGFARYLVEQGDLAKQKGIAISYDSRNFSPEFAGLTARIFASYGIKVYLSDELRPVPMLSFAIRYYQCAGGVMITASHNPAKYNGFKAYGADGSQFNLTDAEAVSKHMASIQDYPGTIKKAMTLEAAIAAGLIQMVGEEWEEAYLDKLLQLSIHPKIVQKQKDFKIVYTPLNGTGNKPVRKILKNLGFENVFVVPEQEEPDGNFPSVAIPNPELPETLALGITLAKKEKAELLLATDPDADRLGVCVRDKTGEYRILEGNQIGILLMDYILGEKQQRHILPAKSFCVTTIVSSRLTEVIANYYHVELFRVLTGFKFIGEIIRNEDEFGDKHFQFGFEESFGYLAGRDVRDKDAVVSAMLIAEMAAVSADRGESLYERLEKLYQKYGYAAEKTLSFYKEGKTGLEKIAHCMHVLRTEKISEIAGLKIKALCDYQTGERFIFEDQTKEALTLPQSNVLLYELEGYDWMCVRPSGTEPKIKIYFGIYGEQQAENEARLEKLMTEFTQIVEQIIEA